MGVSLRYLIVNTRQVRYQSPQDNTERSNKPYLTLQLHVNATQSITPLI